MRKINREPEAHIIELLNAIQAETNDWQAIYFAFDQLMEHYRSDYQIKIAINLMNDLLGDRDGAIYICEDTSIFVIVHNLQKPLYDKLTFQLRYLFMDDPLAYDEEGDENPAFCMRYDLQEQWEEFMKLTKRRLVQRVRKNQRAASDVPKSMKMTEASEEAKADVAAQNEAAALKNVATNQAQQNSYFNASNLYMIEQRLREVDITAAIRRQPVCAVGNKGNPRTVFDEMYINIMHLKQLLEVDADILSNPWLFKYLTQVLDDKMLSNLQAHAGSFAKSPVSINVNIPTLLSDRFAEFDSTINPSAKVSVVMELQVADVFSNMAGFLVAKKTVQKLGYRVCLDGLSDLSFPQIDRQGLGFDLVKLQWNADTDTDLKTDQNKALIEAVKRCGSTRVILTRCDNEAAINYGRAIGISLFQGRYLDSLVNPQSKIQN